MASPSLAAYVVRRIPRLGRRAFISAAVAASACRATSRTGDGGMRVVSLSPSTTEAMFAIGAGHLLVGRTDNCDYPPAASALPTIGGYAGPNREAVLALRPTLVIGEQGPVGPSIEQQLRAHGIDTFFPNTDSVAEITSMIRRLGERVEHAQSANQLAQRIDTRIIELAEWAYPRTKPGVVMVLDVSPIFVAGPGSFPDELVGLAGGVNLIRRGGKWPTIDIEHLRSLDPQILVDAMSVGHTGGSRLGTAPGWDTLTAVREGHVRRLTSAAALRPGPRITDGLVDIARAIHGEGPR
jgi:iron complex transport system substrate-binding protein